MIVDKIDDVDVEFNPSTKKFSMKVCGQTLTSTSFAALKTKANKLKRYKVSPELLKKLNEENLYRKIYISSYEGERYVKVKYTGNFKRTTARDITPSFIRDITPSFIFETEYEIDNKKYSNFTYLSAIVSLSPEKVDEFNELLSLKKDIDRKHQSMLRFVGENNIKTPVNAVELT